MGSKTGLSQIDMRKPDGSIFSRLEMETQLREKLSTVHHRRLKAINLGLPSKTAYDMYPISVTHWILDQWCEKGEVSGWVLGVRSEFKADNDPEYFRQLTQRLAIFVEEGWALLPNPGEGIEMSQMNQPPGPPMPMPPNGQSQFAPPIPQQMPPMPGMPPMPMGPQMPQQGYPQQPQMPQMPPMPGQPMAPGMPPMPPTPPQQFQQPYPQQPPAPPQPPMPPQPQYQQAPAPQQQVPQGVGIPTKADPSRQWGQAGKREDGTARTRRTKEEVSEDNAYQAWCAGGGDPNIGAAPAQQQPQYQQPAIPQAAPPQQQMIMPPQPGPSIAPPNPFGGMGGPPPIPQAAPQQPQFGAFPGAAPPQPQAAPASNEAKLQEEVSGLRDEIDTLSRRLDLLNKGLAFIMRGMLQNKGELDVHLVLAEMGLLPR